MFARKKGRWMGAVAAVVAATFVWAATAGPAEPPAVVFRDGLLSFDVRDVAIEDLLLAVGEKTGIPIAVSPGLNERITLRLRDRTLEEVLAAVCGNRAVVYEYNGERKDFRIVAAGAVAGIAGEGAGLIPPGTGTTLSDPGVSAVLSEAAAGTERKKTVAASPDRGNPVGREEPRDTQGRPLYKSREILIQFRPGVDGDGIAALHRTLGSMVISSYRGGLLQRLRVRDGISEPAAAALYRESPLVELAERHALRYPLRMPNDPEYPGKQWNLQKISMPQAWDINLGRPEVAVIDTGVDYTHPDLGENIWINAWEIPDNRIDDEGNSYVDDVRGWDFADGDNDPKPYPTPQKPNPDSHGTHVAGIIAAVTDNALGIAGTAWRSRIMALKVQSDADVEMLEADIVAAVDYAIARGARIVNCSFGGETYDPIEYQAFVRLREQGILAVCAASNNSKNVDTDPVKTYPAYYDLDNIISVAWTDGSDNLAAGSNYGAASVDLAAPGGSVFSTCHTGSSEGGYCYKSGTSMAAPHVAGAAALVMAANAGWDYRQVRAALLDTVDSLPQLAGKVASGGRLNAYAAVRAALLPGDVNGDGRVLLDDAVGALQITADMRPDFPSGMAPAWADMDGDGKIGAVETIFILQKAAELR